MEHIHSFTLHICVYFEVKDILLIASHKITECDELSVLINFKGFIFYWEKYTFGGKWLAIASTATEREKKNAQQIKGYAVLGRSYNNETNLPTCP